MSSVAVRTSSTSPKPSSPRRVTTSRTRISGTDAPEVSPTVSASATHSGRTSAAESTRYEAPAPASSATSTSRTEFEEFAEPTTITTSQRGASFFTATCRFCVA